MPSIAKSFIQHGHDSPAYWQIGNLWQVMATGVQTDNAFTLLDQIVHSGGGGGPMTHTHSQDEGLYVIKGRCIFNAGGHQGLPGTPGTFVAIPGNTEHSFSVEEADTHVLNFYLPAGFEQLLIGISRPATERIPPPPELVGEMLPPKELSTKLALQYGQTNILGDPFNDPPNADLMYTRSTPGATVFPFTANAADLPAFQVRDGAWTILASGKQTGNSYSLMQLRLRQGLVFSPHLFKDKDVIYYILDGKMTFLHSEKVETVSKGALVFIPRGTVHASMVESDEALCLNLHTPGGFEEYVELIGTVMESKNVSEATKTKNIDARTLSRLKNKLEMVHVVVQSPF